MTRITRRPMDKAPLRTSAEAQPASPPAMNSTDAPKLLSTKRINDDLTEMGIQGQDTGGDLHHADVFRALFYSSKAPIDERLPSLSGEWAPPDYTDEEGLDILRSIHHRRQPAIQVTPVLATEMPAHDRLAGFYEAGLITPSEELEVGSDDEDPETLRCVAQSDDAAPPVQRLPYNNTPAFHHIVRGTGATSVRIDADYHSGHLPTRMLRAVEDDCISRANSSQVGHHESLAQEIGTSQPDSRDTGEAAGDEPRDPFPIVLSIDNGTYPNNGDPAPARLQYNDADRNIGSLDKAQGVVSTIFEGIGAHGTIIPKSLLSGHERPASDRSSRDDSRTPVLTEDDIDTYLADQETAYAWKSKELEAEAAKKVKDKWAALKKQAKEIAPPKITPTVKKPAVPKNLRRSTRQRQVPISDQNSLPRSAIPKKPSPLSQQMSATLAASVSETNAPRPSARPFETSVAQLLSKDDSDDDDYFTTLEAVRERTRMETSGATSDSSANEGDEGLKVAAEETQLEELDSNSLQRVGPQPVHQASDENRLGSETTPEEDQENGSVSAPVNEPTSEELVAAEKFSRSAHASSRKRDGSGRFQSKKKSVLTDAENAKVTKTKAKKRSK